MRVAGRDGARAGIRNFPWVMAAFSAGCIPTQSLRQTVRKSCRGVDPQSGGGQHLPLWRGKKSKKETDPTSVTDTR